MTISCSMNLRTPLRFASFKRGLTISAIFMLSIVISFFSVSVAICTWLVMLVVDSVVFRRRFR